VEIEFAHLSALIMQPPPPKINPALPMDDPACVREEGERDRERQWCFFFVIFFFFFFSHPKISLQLKKQKTPKPTPPPNCRNLRADPRARSVSPPPVYDGSGRRVNTRERRWAEHVTAQRHALVARAVASVPGYAPPPGYQKPRAATLVKVPIPYKQFPHVNFVGLILGPRGRSLRKMEEETGARIAIRGRGSVKEGKVRRDGRRDPSEDEDLHVQISSDDPEKLERARIVIEKILVPIPDEVNERKKLQVGCRFFFFFFLLLVRWTCYM
jgi:hypothetical protein